MKRRVCSTLAFVLVMGTSFAIAQQPAPRVLSSGHGSQQAARPAPPPQPAAPSLYKRLGGYDAIAAVTDEFLTRMILDKQLGRFFVGMSTGSKTVLREHVINFLCDLAGGPCHYIGKDLKPAHEGLGITEADWKLAVAHLTASLNKFSVAAQERTELINAIAALKDDIVEKR